MAADLASDLGFLLAVVVVEKVVRGIAGRAHNQFWDHVRLSPSPDGAKRLPMNSLVLS